MFHGLGQGTRRKSCCFFSPQHCQAAMGARLVLGSLTCTAMGQNSKQSSLPWGWHPRAAKHAAQRELGGHFLFLPLWE